MARMKARVFYPSIYCDGTVSVFTVGTAEGRMLKNVDTRDDCVIVCLMYVGASHIWTEGEFENKTKMPETKLQSLVFLR